MDDYDIIIKNVKPLSLSNHGDHLLITGVDCRKLPEPIGFNMCTYGFGCDVQLNVHQ